MGPRRHLNVAAAMGRVLDDWLGIFATVDHEQQVKGPAEITLNCKPVRQFVEGDIGGPDKEIGPR